MFKELVMALREGKCVVFEADEQGGIRIREKFEIYEQARNQCVSDAECYDGNVLPPTVIIASLSGCGVQ